MNNQARVYLLTLAGVALAALIRFLLGPTLGATIPVVLFTVPVAAGAFYGGFGPALTATVVSAVIADFFFIPPYYELVITDATAAVVLTSFLVVGLLISLLGGRLKASEREALRNAERLNETTRKLEEADKRKDEFLAMLAHELRNPLAGIAAAADLQRAAWSDPERLKRAAYVITRQVEHMTKLVDDLLDVARITRGHVTLQIVTTCLQDVVHDATQQVQSLVQRNQHSLTLSLPAEPVYVEGDSVRLVQVVTNLLVNAAKYTPSAGHILLSLEAKNGVAKLTVTDDGIGLSPDLLSSVFDTFVQAERGHDREYGGLGLGLAIVKKLVEMHGGTVSARSPGPGKGSSFEINLPVADSFST